MKNNDFSWNRGDCHRSISTVYENQWFKIKNRDSYYSVEYEVPQVVILPLVGSNILMVRVKRPLINDAPWELPAGGNHISETPIETARRELEEETGIYIEKLVRFEPMQSLSETPGRSSELLLIFKVKITPTEFKMRRNIHEDEILEVKLVNVEKIKQAIISGEIYSSSPIAVISRYLFERESRSLTLNKKKLL